MESAVPRTRRGSRVKTTAATRECHRSYAPLIVLRALAETGDPVEGSLAHYPPPSNGAPHPHSRTTSLSSLLSQAVSASTNCGAMLAPPLPAIVSAGVVA